MADKTLVFMRHANAGWQDSGASDFERALTHRGARNAPMMGERIVLLGIRPELIVSSPATRAAETAAAVANAMNIPPEKIRLESSAYAATSGELLDIIHAFSEEADCIMLVGHNPGITELANIMAGEDIGNVPTCGVVILDTGATRWRDVASKPASLLEFDYPGRLA